MSLLQKQRYVALLRTGAFTRLNPEQLDGLHSEVGHFLKAGSDYLDAVDLFDLYELQFYLSILTNHDVEAKSYLDRFNDQFAGKKSQKIMVMRSMYYEATGDTKAAIDALGSDPNELRASRRLATFSRTRADGSYNAAEYIKSLNYYLDLQPSDIKAWAELGDAYSSVGHYEKAVFCFKEVLLHVPDAHNFFYKAGLNLYLQHLHNLGQKSEKKDALLENLRVFEHARDCFLGCVDINEFATNAWLGIYLLAKSPLLDKLSSSKSVPSAKNIEQLCTDMAKLGELSQRQIMKHEGLADEDAFSVFLQENK